MSCIQVESALQVQKLKPTIDAIKAQYGDDKKAVQRETSALYEASGVNPSAGGQATTSMGWQCLHWLMRGLGIDCPLPWQTLTRTLHSAMRIRVLCPAALC